MPHITEEIYQIYFIDKEKSKSIHVSPWPECEDNLIDDKLEKAGDVAVEVVSAVRQFKNQNQKSLKEPVKLLIIDCEINLEEFIEDIKSATHAEKIEFGKGIIEVSSDLKIDVKI